MSETAFYERASPTLLTEQPASLLPAAPIPSYWNELRQHLETRLSMLRNWRLSWWQHWALLAEYILPRRYHWLIVPNTMNRGFAINQHIVDPTGTQAMRICSAGMMSGLCSPSRPWFKLKVRGMDELDQEAKIWLDEVESRMYAVYAGSNFYDSMAQMFEDLVTFGTAPLLIYEDSTEIIRLQNPCAGEYFLAVGPSFRVESFYRLFVYTIIQIVEEFGLEHCPQEIQSLWAEKGGSLENERIIAHAIEPNFPIRSRGSSKEIDPLKGQFTYREVYWIWGTQGEQPLSLRGFQDAPFVAPRWAITSNDAYGRSPGMDALPDVMQLQVETKRKAEAIEKQVRPPLLASVELKNEPSSILPGHVTYVSQLGPGTGMRPIYEVQPDLQFMTADLKEIQARIQRGFFNDLFLMLQAQGSDRMTAYEVAQRQQEKLQVLGPVIERFQNECLTPTNKRTFNIMKRKNILPPVPESLKAAAISIDYISILALAQRAASTASIERVLATGGSMVASAKVSPAFANVLDNIDGDEALREYGELLTTPHKIFKSRDVVAKERAARAAQQQQEQAGAQAGMEARAAVEGAKTMSQTDVGGGANMLSSILGTGSP